MIIIVHADDDSTTLCVAIASSFLEKLWRDRGEIESQSFYCFTCRLVPRMKIVRDAIKGNFFFLLEIRYREVKLGSSSERTLVALVATHTLRDKWKKFLCCLHNLLRLRKKTFTLPRDRCFHGMYLIEVRR